MKKRIVFLAATGLLPVTGILFQYTDAAAGVDCPPPSRMATSDRMEGHVQVTEEFCRVKRQGNWIRHGPYQLSHTNKWTNDADVTRGSYRNGKKHGKWVRTVSAYDSGRIRSKSEEHYKDGRLHGPERSYKSGRLVADGRNVDGKPHGRFRTWDEGNGALASEKWYDHGRPRGVWLTWTGKVKQSETPHVDGAIHGWVKKWDIRGNLSSRAQYVRGKRDGVTELFSGGRRVERQVHRNGLESGRWIRWWPSGGLRELGTYRMGRSVGFWTTWHENGRLARQDDFLDGKRHGTQSRYDPNGRVVERCVFIMGVRTKCRTPR